MIVGHDNLRAVDKNAVQRNPEQEDQLRSLPNAYASLIPPFRPHVLRSYGHGWATGVQGDNCGPNIT
jgi:hypothetical protein